jgi:hypothetical protein
MIRNMHPQQQQAPPAFSKLSFLLQAPAGSKHSPQMQHSMKITTQA